MGPFLQLIFLLLFVCFLLVAGPWIFIWSINTLISSAMAMAPAETFVPQIAFGFWTWLAAVFVGGLAIIPSSLRSRK